MRTMWRERRVKASRGEKERHHRGRVMPQQHHTLKTVTSRQDGQTNAGEGGGVGAGDRGTNCGSAPALTEKGKYTEQEPVHGDPRGVPAV